MFLFLELHLIHQHLWGTSHDLELAQKPLNWSPCLPPGPLPPHCCSSQIAKRAKLSKLSLFNTLGRLPTAHQIKSRSLVLAYPSGSSPLTPTLQSCRTAPSSQTMLCLCNCAYLLSLSRKASSLTSSPFPIIPHFLNSHSTPKMKGPDLLLSSPCKLDHSTSFSDGLTDHFLLFLL